MQKVILNAKSKVCLVRRGAYKRQFMVPGTFTYGYQLSCDYLYVVLLLAPYISLF